MTAQSTLAPVQFHGAILTATAIDGVPFVAMRPICEAIGLDWAAQYTRIKRHPVLAKGVVVTTTPSAGGEQQTVMLPLTLLNGWLFGVSVSRVKPELRKRLTHYQAECFDVLAGHFMPQRTAPTGICGELYAQALGAEKREAKSSALASAGSRAMLLRKSEKAELLETLALMREAVQLRLALGFTVMAA